MMTEQLAFDETFIPQDTLPGIESDDLTCQVCGKALSYSGRGRKPKFCEDHRKTSGTSGSNRSGGGRSDKDVDAACAALAGLYELGLGPLALIDMNAARAWSQQIDGLNSRNRTILAGDPALARRIVASASKGGGFALALSHVVAVAPVALVMYGDFRARHAAQADYDAPAQPETPPVVDPDYVFGQR